MTRRQKEHLRTRSEEEKSELERVTRSNNRPAVQVIRAKIILAVAEGMTYTDTAKSVGRRSDKAVSNLVSRFNKEGLEALTPRHGGVTFPHFDGLTHCPKHKPLQRRAG